MNATGPPPLPNDDWKRPAVVLGGAAGLLFLILLVIWLLASGGASTVSEGGVAAGSNTESAAIGEDNAADEFVNGDGASTELAAKGASDIEAGNQEQSLRSAPSPEIIDGFPADSDAATATTSPSISRRYEFYTERRASARSEDQASSGTSSKRGTKADFFGVAAAGTKFVYVVDKSSSMATGRFDAAREELLRSLRKLEPNQSFYVIFYDDIAYPQPSDNLLPARSSNIRRVSKWIETAVSQGGTEPMSAITMAIKLEPDAIFVLSDGEFDPSVVVRTAQMNRGSTTKVHSIAFENDAQTLQDLARENGGTYRLAR